MPDQLNLPFTLWTRQAVGQLLQKRYGVRLSKWQVGRYLAVWGYTPQKPVCKAIEQNQATVKWWLEQQYPAIHKRAAKQGAIIYWGDETGMRSDHQAGRSYAPKGVTPQVKGTGQRFSLNMISAVSNRGHLQFMMVEGSFNSEVFIRFLKQLIKGCKKKIFLIVDGHPAHKTKKVNEWLWNNKEKISLFHLPPYSPELNPDEYLNQDLKTNALGRKRPLNKAHMKRNAENFMNMRQKDKKQVQKYFHERHVQYAATEI